jgi:hypothetical protein
MVHLAFGKEAAHVKRTISFLLVRIRLIIACSRGEDNDQQGAFRLNISGKWEALRRIPMAGAKAGANGLRRAAPPGNIEPDQCRSRRLPASSSIRVERFPRFRGDGTLYESAFDMDGIGGAHRRLLALSAA